MKIFLIIAGSLVAVSLFAYWLHGRIRQKLCCGTCGCNLVSEETKKKMLARRAKRALRKSKKCGGSCPAKRP